MIPFLAHTPTISGFNSDAVYPFDSRVPIGCALYLDSFFVETQLNADFVPGARSLFQLYVNGRPYPLLPGFVSPNRDNAASRADLADLPPEGFGVLNDGGNSDLGLWIPQGSLLAMKVTLLVINDYVFKGLLTGRLH